MRISMLTLCLCATVSMVGCNDRDETAATSPTPPATTAPAAAEPTTPPAAATMSPPPAAASAGSIGVAECDDYLTKYEACLTDSVPEASRAGLKQSLEATRAGWAQAAATPEGRAGLKTACEQMVTAARQNMQAFGCTDF